MMSLEDALADLGKRRANLAKLGKAVTSDKDKAHVVKLLDGLIGRLKPLVVEKRRIDQQIKESKKLADDVKDFNDRLKSVGADARKLSDLCDPLRGRADTPQRDFSGISNDAQTVDALGPLRASL